MRHNISEISEIIEDRRTIKPEQFSSREVHVEIIEKMLNAAKWAPTHALTQPWHFTVFRKEGLARFAQFHAQTYQETTKPEDFKEKNFEMLLNRPLLASAIIAIGMKRQETEKIPEIEEIAAVACAVQNMCLVATAYGIGTYWGTGGKTYSDEMKRFLNLGPKDRCLGLLHIGYPSIEWPKGQRRPIEYFSTFVEA